jgi:hypothetical protein
VVITDDWQAASEDDASGLPDYLVRETDKGLEINKGVIYRIPKPHELGMAGSIIERALDAYVGDDPDAYDGLAKTIGGMLMPSLVPDAITPVAEHATGQNFFTGRPIVPQYLEKEVPAMQYTDYTSESAKSLGKILGGIPVAQEQSGSSPMVIENYVRGWTGTLGMYALQLSDAALIKSGAVPDPVRPATALADIPAVKAFVIRYPSAQAQSIQTFYDEFDRANRAMTSLRRKMKEGSSEEVDYILEEYGDRLKNLDGYRQALTKQSQLIHNINKHPEWLPEEKRQMIDTVYYQMIEISRAGIEMSREFDKAAKEIDQEEQE